LAAAARDRALGFTVVGGATGLTAGAEVTWGWEEHPAMATSTTVTTAARS
jgi:hypothetical protein